MKTKIIAFVSALTKNFLTWAIIMLGAIAALMGVQAFQQLSTTPSDAWNQSLSSPILSKVWGIFERDTMSLQAISESLGIKKTPKIMFITSQTYNWGHWGLWGADAICQWLADNAASLPAVKGKRWMALLSDNNTPLKWRFPFLHSKIVTPQWVTIFDNTTAINYFIRPDFGFPATFNNTWINSILIDKDERWWTQTNKYVWTGTMVSWDTYRVNTATTNNCNNWTYWTNAWTNLYYTSLWYNYTTNNNQWLYYTTGDCQWPYHLYCLEI